MIKKNQMEMKILKLKNTVFETKNSLGRLNRRLERAKKKKGGGQ